MQNISIHAQQSVEEVTNSKDNVNEILNRSNANEAVTQHLKENCHETKTKRGRKRKLNIQPGKSFFMKSYCKLIMFQLQKFLQLIVIKQLTQNERL